MVDKGSPVTRFALDEVKKIMKREKMQVREMIILERYVDFNEKPLQLLGNEFCELQVNNSYIKKARILMTRKIRILIERKSICGREGLSSTTIKTSARNRR